MRPGEEATGAVPVRAEDGIAADPGLEPRDETFRAPVGQPLGTARADAVGQGEDRDLPF